MNINNTNNSNLLLNNNTHHIIKQSNTFSIERKLLTIHAIDRDNNYFKNSNSFSIKTPVSYSNIQSIRLIEISFPNNILNFSNNLNNNSFLLNPNTNFNDVSLSTINNGFYSYSDLSEYLTNLPEFKNSNIKVEYEEKNNDLFF